MAAKRKAPRAKPAKAKVPRKPGRAKAHAAPAPRQAAAPAPRSAPVPTRPASVFMRKPGAAASPQAPPSANERDYLVIFEEPDPYGLPADDTLVLDIEQPDRSRPEVDVQQKVAIELTNTTSRMGTTGFAVTVLGGVLGIGLMGWFASVYPTGLVGHNGVMRAMILLSVASLILMIAGTMLTHYGRRIQARGRLSDVRIVEKSSQSKASLE